MGKVALCLPGFAPRVAASATGMRRRVPVFDVEILAAIAAIGLT